MRSSPLNRIRPLAISRDGIIFQAEELTKKYAWQSNLEVGVFAINFDAIYEQIIYPDYGIELRDDLNLGFDADGSKILGQFDPASNTAFIDASLTYNDPRRTFVCWHEVGGHGILQGVWLRRQLARMRYSIVTTEESLSPQTIDVLERQANLFAAHAGAPTWYLNFVLCKEFALTRPIRYIGQGEYCLDVRKHMKRYTVESLNELCRIIAYHIRYRFGGLSVEALSYRIQQLPWITDISRKPILLHRTAKPARAIAKSFASVISHAS
jgi:hypothetical protein